MMIHDIYYLAHAGDRRLTRLDVTANNIANVSTTGYKTERIFFRPVAAGASQSYNFSPVYDELSRIDFRPGNLQRTGNNLDLALEGQGFFTVMEQEVRHYTRNGNFTLDQDRRLVTMSGQLVMGEGGPLVIPSGRLDINPQGEIAVDGSIVGRLQIVTFPDETVLRKVGTSLFVPREGDPAVPAENALVRSGYLEAANVEVIREMTEMIMQQRVSDIYLRAMQTIAELDRLATTRLGKMA